MNRITAILFLLSSALLLPFQTYGQKVGTIQHRQYEDNSIFMQAAAEKSLLTRGTVAPEYRFQHNGTWYAETKEFKKGEVLYNSRLYRDVLLNIDACKNLLVVKTGIITATDRNFVDYAIIDGEKYVNLQFNNRTKNSPEGFLKLESDGGICFYSQVRKSIQSSSGYHNGDDIGYYDNDYKEYVRVGTSEVQVETYFSYSKKYYAVKDGICYQIKNRRSLLKLFDKETARLLRKYASSAGLSSAETTLDVYAKGILAYWNDNMQEGQR